MPRTGRELDFAGQPALEQWWSRRARASHGKVRGSWFTTTPLDKTSNGTRSQYRQLTQTFTFSKWPKSKVLDGESRSHAKCAGLGGQNATGESQAVRFVTATKYNAPTPVQLLHLLRGNAACPNCYREDLPKVGCLVGAMKRFLQ